MYKFKLYIVTHNHEEALDRCLKSISNSDIDLYSNEINIINNYGKLKIKNTYGLEVNILDNVLRPDHSTGHLGRNWNQAIINGFADLRNPQCEFVVCLQVDTEVLPQCFSRLERYHSEGYEFIQEGRGDQLMSWSPKGIIEIGLFDERICGIGFQEGEYFDRAERFLSKNISLNDMSHNRIHNAIPKRLVTDYGDSTHVGLLHGLYKTLWHYIKYDKTRYFMYPFFEKDLSESLMESLGYVGWEDLLVQRNATFFNGES